MKASQLIEHLEDFIARRGDGDVCIGALETIPDVETVGECEDLEGTPAFILYPEGPPLTEHQPSDQEIAEEITEIGRDMEARP